MALQINLHVGKEISYRRYDDDEVLKAVFHEENIALSKLLDLPVDEMGYPV